MKILEIFSDMSGCKTYRLDIPNRELKRFSVETVQYCFLPRYVNANEFETLINMVASVDLVIVQRCYLLDIFRKIREACNFVGTPLVFETDDDYINLDEENPAFMGMVGKEFLMSGPTRQQLLERRQQVINQYVELISLADLVTVSTPELKRTLYRFNKNIEVLENNVEQVFEFRSQDPEDLFVHNGVVDIAPEGSPAREFGVSTVPAYCLSADKKTATFTPRIGYTGTPSHRGADWQSIEEGYSKTLSKYNDQCWWLYVGDPWFHGWHNATNEVAQKKNPAYKNRNFHIPASPYDMYIYHLRNLDIGIAPLTPSIFNMSKSDIKAVEYGMWGVAPLLPNFITYSRNWVHGENCFLYNNAKEFSEYLELLINDAKIRATIGRAALEYVKANRLEKFHTEKRYKIYKQLVDDSYRLKVFRPDEPSSV